MITYCIYNSGDADATLAAAIIKNCTKETTVVDAVNTETALEIASHIRKKFTDSDIICIGFECSKTFNKAISKYNIGKYFTKKQYYFYDTLESIEIVYTSYVNSVVNWLIKNIRVSNEVGESLTETKTYKSLSSGDIRRYLAVYSFYASKMIKFDTLNNYDYLDDLYNIYMHVSFIQSPIVNDDIKTILNDDKYIFNPNNRLLNKDHDIMKYIDIETFATFKNAIGYDIDDPSPNLKVFKIEDNVYVPFSNANDINKYIKSIFKKPKKQVIFSSPTPIGYYVINANDLKKSFFDNEYYEG